VAFINELDEESLQEVLQEFEMPEYFKKENFDQKVLE